MPRLTKTRAQRIHARRRALERYELDLNRHDLREVVESIQAGKATFVRRQSLRVSIWEVTVKGQACRVVYDKLRKTIVTFLPLDPK